MTELQGMRNKVLTHSNQSQNVQSFDIVTKLSFSEISFEKRLPMDLSFLHFTCLDHFFTLPSQTEKVI